METNVPIYKLGDLKHHVMKNNPVIYRFNWDNEKWEYFELMNSFIVDIGKGRLIEFKEGFKWDLSSVPSFLWWLFKPFGRFDLAYIVHDKVYQKKGKMNGFNLTRKEGDELMKDIALELTDTRKISFRRLDSWIRYHTVRLFGWKVWNKDN